MTENERNFGATDLRKAIEEIVLEKFPLLLDPDSAHSPDDLSCVVNEWRQCHELQVALIDLELQNRILLNLQAELTQVRDEALHANRAKSEFLGHMSHEMRTPLNAILGFSQLFGSDQSLSRDTRDNARYIEQAGQQLLSLIDDMIDLARIDSGKMTLSVEPVRVGSVTAHCFGLLASKAGECEVSLSEQYGNGKDAFIEVDPMRLRQVVLNLLSNAIKYNRSGGTVQLSYTLKQGTVRLSVTDTGIGIASEKHPSVFKAFDRLGAENSAVEGAGIGLVITRNIVQAMGGSIGFESRLGEGSLFWVEFPLCAARLSLVPVDDREGSGAVIAAEPEDRAQVLYIDDSLMNLRLMRQIFETWEHFVLHDADSARTGLELAFANLPDVILMDINMPVMSGFEALAILKGDPRTAHIPVIAVTANAMRGDAERGQQAGFADYLTKPIVIPRLLALLNACCGKH